MFIINLDEETTTVHFYLNPASTSSESISSELKSVSDQLLSIEEHVQQIICSLGNFRIPLAERLDIIQTTLSQLIQKAGIITRLFQVILIIILQK